MEIPITYHDNIDDFLQAIQYPYETKPYPQTKIQSLKMSLSQFKQFVQRQDINDEMKQQACQFAEEAYGRGNTVHITETGPNIFKATFLPKHIVNYYPAAIIQG